MVPAPYSSQIKIQRLVKPSGKSESVIFSVGTTIFGIVLEVIALLFIGGNWIAEEKLFGLYYLHPIEVVGWEGFWGACMYSVLLVIFQFIPCHNDKICLYGTVEDTLHAFYEWGLNNWLWVFAILLVIWTAVFNIFNVAVTKYASAAQRSTVDTCRTALIWMFFIIYQGEGHERFIWLELVGFFMLIFGTLMHTEIIVFPCFGFDRNTRKALAIKYEEGKFKKSLQKPFLIGSGINNTQANKVKLMDTYEKSDDSAEQGKNKTSE